MKALLAWYRGREKREQQILLAGAIVVPILLVLFGLSVLSKQVSTAAARLEHKQQDIAWLQTVVPQLVAQQQRQQQFRGGAGGRAGRAGGNESLVVTADRVARESGLTLSSSEPGGNGALRVRTDKASFDSLALWLGQLTQRYGVKIENASIDAADADGVVNATLILRGR